MGMLTRFACGIDDSTNQKRPDGLPFCGSEIERFAPGIELKIMKSIRCRIHCSLNVVDQGV